MRIISLLPSATEIVYALGLEGWLVGVTHECNWPPPAAHVRHVSHSTIPAGVSSAQIDELVTQAAAGGEPTTWLDESAIRELAPDLILTQDLCVVCAVPAGEVDAALSRLGCSAQVLSLDPSSLSDMLDGIVQVGVATGRRDAGEQLVSELRARLDAVRAAVAGQPRAHVLALEWADPPFNAGHWVPEMIDLAGGQPVLAEPSKPSVRVEWSAIEQTQPDVVAFMPCGYSLAAAVQEAREVLLPHPALAQVPTVIAAHGDAFFSRPGPRLIDGVEILAGLLHPTCWPLPPSAAAQTMRAPAGCPKGALPD